MYCGNVSPAPAGMIPTEAAELWGISREPRTRGDDPGERYSMKDFYT